MAEDSRRRGASPVGPLLLAVIFLAVLGGGVGFSLGTLSKHQRNAAATHDGGTGTSGQDATPDATAGRGGGGGPRGGEGGAAAPPAPGGAGPLPPPPHLPPAPIHRW